MSDPSCPLCGAAVRPVDLEFCPSCGAALTASGDAEPFDPATHRLADRVIDAAVARAGELRAGRIRALAAGLEDAGDGRRMLGVGLAGAGRHAIRRCDVLVDALPGYRVRATLVVAIRAPARLGDPAPSIEAGSATRDVGWRFATVRDATFRATLVRELDSRDDDAVGELVDALKLLCDAWQVPSAVDWVISVVDRPASGILRATLSPPRRTRGRDRPLRRPQAVREPPGRAVRRPARRLDAGAVARHGDPAWGAAGDR